MELRAVAASRELAFDARFDLSEVLGSSDTRDVSLGLLGATTGTERCLSLWSGLVRLLLPDVECLVEAGSAPTDRVFLVRWLSMESVKGQYLVVIAVEAKAVSRRAPFVGKCPIRRICQVTDGVVLRTPRCNMKHSIKRSHQGHRSDTDF